MAALMALSLDTSGNYAPDVSMDNTSSKSLKNKLYDLNQDISNKINSDNAYNFQDTSDKTYTFNDKNFILDQYDNIPARNREKPAYGKLVFDDINNYFCYIYKRNGAGLHQAFLKTHEILEKNGLNDFDQKHNSWDDIRLPIEASTDLPEGYIHKASNFEFFMIDGALSLGLGYYIHRIWDVKNHKGEVEKYHKVEVLFNKNEYIIRIYP